jgi:hypothetical protein
MTSFRPICEQPMRPSLRLVIAAALMVLWSGAPPSMAARPAQPDVDALLQHLDDLYRSKSSIARGFRLTSRAPESGAAPLSGLLQLSCTAEV